MLPSTTNIEMELPKPKAKTNIISRFNYPDHTKEFIVDHFKVRTCFKSCYNEKKKSLCKCNKELIEHTENLILKENWSYENNTKLDPCDTFGYINFNGYEYVPPGHYPRFIKFDCLENCELTCASAYELLVAKEHWNITAPKLIISINGGCKRMKFISNQHKKNFKQGLIDVMKKDQTWVIANGFNVGIHKLVSETINEFRLHQEDLKDQVTLIGISTWGAVMNNNKLHHSSRVANARHQFFRYENTSDNNKGKVTLDALYDYFLFCDDGTEKQYDKEVDFRLKLENYVKKQADGFLVQILFEGGRRAIKNAFQALKDKVPLVVIKGSGRAANIISDVMELPLKNYKENIVFIIKENIDNLDLPKGEKQQAEIDQYTNYLEEMYTNFKKQVIVYDMMDTSIRFDKKILEAMIIGADKSLEKTLKLCIRFNCPNIADRFVFSNATYGNLDQAEIKAMFKTSITDNRPEFVNLFVENNFEVEQFVNEDNLKDLYKVSFDPDKCQCAELLSDLSGNTRNSWFSKNKNLANSEPDILSTVGIIIKKLSGNILNCRYQTTESGIDKKCEDEDSFSSIDDMEEEEESHKEYTTQDMFLWSLLSGRTDISQILWKIGKDHIASALIASTILRNMAALVLVRGDHNLQTKLSNAANKYQDLAVSIITESYNKSKSKTYTLIVRELKRWNKLTCLHIAINGDMLDFINHSACRSYTTKVWMGDLSPYLSTWKLILTIPFSLLLLKLVIMPTFPQKKIGKDETVKVNYQNKQLIPDKDKAYNEIKKNKIQNISFCKAFNVFYRAPIVKFYIHLFSYVAFLMIFSYMNLVELVQIGNVNSVIQILAEVYVYVYVLTFTIEEIRQVFDQEIRGFTYKISTYFTGTWNKFDAVIIVFFISSTVSRFTIPDQHFMLCRCLFAVTLSMFFVRSMQFYFVNKSIGPKVIMIRDMLRDILFFLSIFVIFVMAYGTLAQTLKFPNSVFGLTLLKDIIYIPYFQTYGELMLDSFEVSGPCNGTDCIIKNSVVTFSFAIFLLLTNVLLVNLLIAMFGYTFNQIQEDSEKLWCFIRIQLVQEFYEKPIFPPPFNIIYYIFRIITLPCMSFCPRILFEQENNLLLETLDKNGNYKMAIYEQSCMETLMIEMNGQKVEKADKTEMSNIAELIDKLNVKSDSSGTNPIESVISFRATFNKRLDLIEKQLFVR